ncbi:MAG: branched-chain amino acid ABC transporter permease [Nitrososphaerota archaeon]
MKKQIPVIVIVTGFFAVFPFLKPDIYYLSALFSLFMYVVLACGWNILGGYTGYMNFGHASFFGTGAYTSALLLTKYGVSPFYTCSLGGLLAALLAGIIGWPCLRLRGPYFVLVTFCLGLVARIIAMNLEFIGASSGLYLPFMKVSMFENRMVFYEAMLAIAFITVLIAIRIENSRFGLGLKAISQDEDSAESQGVDALRLKILALVLSAFLAGTAGGIYSYYRGYVHPDFIFDVSTSILVVLMSLLGGSTTWVGPVAGTFIVFIINEGLTAYANMAAESARIVYGILLVIVILYLPDGLVGLLGKQKIFSQKQKIKNKHDLNSLSIFRN